MENRKRIIFILILAFLIVAGSFYSFWQKNTVIENTSSGEAIAKGASNIEEKPNEMIVYISGAVYKPGVFELPSTARVFDAVVMAGGLTPDADVAKINMAQKLKDGMHIHVETRSSTQGQGGADITSNVSKIKSGSKININTADKSQLDTLPGVGPALAERIVEYRQTNGGFHDIEELKKVSGFGPSKFEKVKDKVTI